VDWKSFAGLLEHRPEFHDLQPLGRQIGYWRPYPGDDILEVAVFWRQHGEDLDLHTGRFVG